MRKLILIAAIATSCAAENVLTNQSGTALTTGDWVSLGSTMNGLTGQKFPYYFTSYDKAFYVPAMDAYCGVFSYFEMSSEPNRSWSCYRFNENRFMLFDQTGAFHNAHLQEGGHPVGTVVSDPTTSLALGEQGASGSQVQEITKWSAWKYDFLGQVGIPQQSPQGLTFANQFGSLAYDPFIKALMGIGGDSASQGYVQYDNDPSHQTANCATAGSNLGTNCYNTWELDAAVTYNGLPASISLHSTAMNTTDKNLYVFGGGGLNNWVWQYQPSTTTWTEVFANQTTSTSCFSIGGGNNCPVARTEAGWAYDANENIFLMYGGCNGVSPAACTPLTDTWIFDPVADTWTQLSTAHTPNGGTGQLANERLVWLPEDDVFVLYTPGNLWAFRYAAGSNGGYRPTTATYSYTPVPASGATTVGPLNRNTTSASAQSWLYSAAIAGNSSTVVVGGTETQTSTFANTPSVGTAHPFVQQVAPSGSCGNLDVGFTCLGAAYTSLTADTSTNVEVSEMSLAMVGSTPWAVWTQSPESLSASVYAKGWNGSAWAGGQVGPGAPSDTIYDGQAQIIAVGSTPTVLMREQDRTGENNSQPQTYCYVFQWNGSAWIAVGSKLNASGTVCDGASIATDGTNIYASYTVYTSTASGATGTTGEWMGPPQVQVMKWNGSTWSQLGSSVNVAGSGCNGTFSTVPAYTGTGCSRAYNTSITFLNGQPYVAFVERPSDTATIQKLWVRTWTGSAWSTVGSTYLNRDPNQGWAFAPQITNDGTNLYITWDEQGNDQPWLSGLALVTPYGQKSHVYVAKLTTSGTLTYLGGAWNADPANGSATTPAITMYNGEPAVAWGEVVSGANRQLYAKQWNGTDAVALTTASGPGTPSLSCPSSATGTVGASYSSSFSASGGTPPYSYSIQSGSLPTGLTLTGSSGLVSGTPTVAGTYNFAGEVTDANTNTGTAACSIVVSAGGNSPNITTTSPLPGGTVSVSYSDTLSGTNSPTNWAVVSGTICSGLGLNTSTGVLSGTPTAAQTCTFGVTASNAYGTSSVATFSLTISAGGSPPSITTTTPLPSGLVGVNYSDTLAATNSPTSWAVSSGTICSGLGLNSSTGVISGIPTTAQTCSFGVTSSNSFGSSSPVTFSLSIAANNAGTRIFGSVAISGKVVIH